MNEEKGRNVDRKDGVGGLKEEEGGAGMEEGVCVCTGVDRKVKYIEQTSIKRRRRKRSNQKVNVLKEEKKRQKKRKRKTYKETHSEKWLFLAYPEGLADKTRKQVSATHNAACGWIWLVPRNLLFSLSAFHCVLAARTVL